jgi:hypothetical protein
MTFPRTIVPLIAALLGTASCAKGNGGGSPTGAGGDMTGAGGSGNTGSPNADKALHVEGNHLVDATGNTVRLIGVGRQGTEYRCLQGTSHSVFQEEDTSGSGANGSDSSLDAMVTWHINTLRLPLNEDCWLAINGATDIGGDFYQTVLADYISRAHTRGFYVILDLHWNAAGTTQALAQQTMADSDHSVAFWQSVATFFKDDPMILFELYNEPILNMGSNMAQGDPWTCWLNGCVTAQGWRAAGMQSLVDAVRNTGATQVLIVNGIEWANNMDSWLAHKPSDPMANIAAGFHVYNNVACNSAGCWNGSPGAVAAQVPLITTEFGDKTNAQGFVNGFMSWADSKASSYIAWSWYVGAANIPSLLTSWSGGATTYGAAVQTHFGQVNP